MLLQGNKLQFSFTVPFLKYGHKAQGLRGPQMYNNNKSVKKIHINTDTVEGQNTQSHVLLSWIRMKEKHVENVRVNTKTTLSVNHCCSSAPLFLIFFTMCAARSTWQPLHLLTQGNKTHGSHFQPVYSVLAFDLIYYSVVMQLRCQAESSTYVPKIQDCDGTLSTGRQSFLDKIWNNMSGFCQFF